VKPAAQQPTLTTPPDPLPTLWQRALANEIARNLAKHGWRTHKELRAISPTGNPRTGGKTSGGMPRHELQSNTDLLSVDVYTWGIVDPENLPAELDVPPLAYCVKQLDLAGALKPEQIPIVEAWLRDARHHRSTHVLFTPQRNRHGRLTLRLNARTALPEVAEVFLQAARAAQVNIVDEDELAEAYAAALVLDVPGLPQLA
jgi:hypothetical protein